VLDGADFLILLRDTSIDGLEEHVAAVYAMQSEELSTVLGAIIGMTFAGSGAFGVAMSQSLSSLEHPAAVLVVIGILVILLALTGIVGVVALQYQLVALRREIVRSTDLIALMRQAYR